MNLDEIYPSKSNSLKAEDLQGREVKCKINGFEVVQFDNGNKIVLNFEGKDKTLVLNKTNAQKIGSAYGNSPEDWKGKDIIIYPDSTNFQGKMVPCIRVRPVLPQATTDDDIPF